MTENFYPIVFLCDFTKCSTHKSLAMKEPHSIKKSTRLPILRLKIKPDIIPKNANKYMTSSSPVVLLCDFTKCSTHKSSFELTKLAINKERKENDIEEIEYIPSSGESTSGGSVTVVKLINKHNGEQNEAKKSTHKTKSYRKRKRIINSDESTGNDYKSEENTSDDSLLNHINKPKRRKKFKKKVKKYRRKNKISKKRKRNVSSDESTSDDYDSDESFIDGYECDESSVDSDESENTSNHSESDHNKRNNKQLNRHKPQKNLKNKLNKHTNKNKKKIKKVLSSDESLCDDPGRSEKSSSDDSASNWSNDSRGKRQKTSKIKQKKSAHKKKVLSTDESSCVEVTNEEYTSDDNDSEYHYGSRKKRQKTYKIKQKKSVRKNNKKYKHKKQVQSTDESSSDNDISEESAIEDNEKSEEIISEDSKNSEENSNDDNDSGDWIYKIKHKKYDDKSTKRDKKKKKVTNYKLSDFIYDCPSSAKTSKFQTSFILK